MASRPNLMALPFGPMALNVEALRSAFTIFSIKLMQDNKLILVNINKYCTYTKAIKI